MSPDAQGDGSVVSRSIDTGRFVRKFYSAQYFDKCSGINSNLFLILSEKEGSKVLPIGGRFFEMASW